MKKVPFIILIFALLSCSAVIKNSGYSSKELIKDQQCKDFSFNFDSVAYGRRFDMMGPFIPIFPSWSDSKSFGLSLKAAEDVKLNDTDCPVIRINGVQQELRFFDEQRKRCSFQLSELDKGDSIELEVKHPSCEPKKIMLEKYENWDYVPPFMVTV